MEDQAFLESDLSPSIKRTWSWRHREGAVVSAGEDTEIALELLSLEAEQKDEIKGLSSQDGYKRLFKVIKEELDTFSNANMPSWRKDFWTTLQCRHHSSVSWISILFFLFEVFALFFTYGSLSSQRSSHVLIEGFIILLISLFNVILCVREENLRRTEMYKCTKQILDCCEGYCSWNPPDYVDPCTPSSPSISLVNTYRDGELISMPCNLLVHGDVIVLGPSQSAPANIQMIETSSEDAFKEEEPLFLEKGQMYKPEVPCKESSDDDSQTTLPCQTHPRKLFVVREAPFKSTLQHLLKSSSNKPISLLENEKHFIGGTVVEKRLLWVIICFSLIVNIARLLLLPNSSGHWTEMVFMLQAYVILPLLPLSFPLLWTTVNLYGASRINILFEKLKDASITNAKVDKDFPVSDVLPQLWNTFLGDSINLPRTANLLKVLGNITVWCCIDRDGILSLPNPSVEKVFFLQSKKSMHQLHHSKLRGRKISSCTWESDISRQTSREDSNLDDASSSSSSDDDDDDDLIAEDGTHLKGRAAVMNVSNDPESQFGLRFDDKNWQEYLNSLKPLGLNILLNSSCSCPVRAMRFSDQTAFLSLARNPKPVHTPQRCLCLLGKEIGFTESALRLFTKQQHIFIVHPLEYPIVGLPALQSSSYLAVCKERPVPSMACLVVKEYQTGSHQLLTQGSPDLVLDACSDFWDGSSLNVINSQDKKKVLDFYQRNSISSQCVAFAYRPCIEVPASQTDVFLKLPSVYQWKSCESFADSFSEIVEDNHKDEDGIKFTSKSMSGLPIDQLLEPVPPVDNAEPYHKLIGNQIFIGMVTLQYQAKKDIIPLVEDLNTAGVRFVHFSSEDELKSRVFAERMGLETGWNCHISLAETGSPRQRTKTDSSSNPPTAAGDDDLHDVIRDVLHDGPEKHVSWVDLKIQESSEQVNKPDAGDPHNKSETSTLLGHEQHLESSEDYWFFYNRAKLPRGVHNIRPHLENVDNVPLLVPLFTDCSSSAVQDMITIMQEHGEVVCCVGSSFNVNNTTIFSQADISIAIEPMFPQLCLKGLPKDFRSGTPQLQPGEKHPDKVTFDLSNEESSSSETENDLSPLELSALLNSLPCSISFHRDTDFKFKSLLKEARRLSFGLRKCFTFILTCQLMLTMMMFLCQCLLLPPPLTGLHLLWLSCITIPLLSISLIGSKSSKGLMSMMTGKNDRTFKDIAYPFCVYFSLGFLPTCVFISVALFPLTLFGFCTKNQLSCHYLLGERNSSQPWNGYGGNNIQALSLAQDINAMTLALFFAIVSTSFVHHLKSLWKRSPFTNIHWVYCVIIVISLQLLYFIISQSIWTSSYGAHYTITDVSSYTIILVFVWPLCSLLFMELILKRRYIKLYIRFQKRAKLKFGTKLGMNSPF